METMMKPISKAAMKRQEHAEAMERLRKWIKPGDTVHTILRHVSRSGMMRHISVVLIDKDGDTLHPDHAVATVLGMSLAHEGIKAQGCGMDMGFAIVYNLSRVLFPDGFGCIGRGCPSNDHSNGDRDYTIHADREAPDGQGHWHKDGGYALKQRWL